MQTFFNGTKVKAKKNIRWSSKLKNIHLDPNRPRFRLLPHVPPFRSPPLSLHPSPSHSVRSLPPSLSISPSLSVCDDWVGYRRRHPTPGGEAFAYLFAGDERPPGIPIPFLFPVCCAKPSFRFFFKKIEFSNCNLLFGYLMPINF